MWSRRVLHARSTFRARGRAGHWLARPVACTPDQTPMRLPPPLLRLPQSIVVLLPVLTLIRVWLPELAHYRVREATISPDVVAAARPAPSDEVLLELRGFYLFPLEQRTPELETRLAERILQGRLELPETPPSPVSLPFAASDLEVASPASLMFAGLVVPELLLAAYASTGRDTFFVAARDYLLAWNAYERDAWLPKGLLWNDHATAARVRVVGEFWRLYRARPDYDPEVGRAVLQQAARYGEFLLRPDHFTFSTNHGVMQNIGLLHLSLAFPSLPQTARYREVALARLHEQMPFFIDAEGVIREHSAGYQAFGLEVLGMAFRALTLAGIPIPDEWARKYERAATFFAQLRRPDATLPANGDTDGAARRAIPHVTTIDAQGRAAARYLPDRWDRSLGATLRGDAGYWVEWSVPPERAGVDPARQTMVTWTQRPPEAHKHADELAVFVWSEGVSWLTGTGYWPYSSPHRAVASSWSSSNAPHLVDEPFGSQRTPRLLASGSNPRLGAVDLERTGPGTFRVRRQVVRFEPGGWVILDVAQTPTAHRTVWTVPPSVNVRAVSAGQFALEATRTSAGARLVALASGGAAIREYRGSETPFAGWHVEHGALLPAPAITIDQPAGESWLVVALTVGSQHSAAGGAPRWSLESPERWALTLPGVSGLVHVAREGDLLRVTPGSGAGRADTLRLAPAPDATESFRALATAYRSIAPTYPRFQEYGARRLKVTYLVLLLVVAQELVLFLTRRFVPRWSGPLRVASVFAWIGVVVWLHGWFLRTAIVMTL